MLNSFNEFTDKLINLNNDFWMRYKELVELNNVAERNKEARDLIVHGFSRMIGRPHDNHVSFDNAFVARITVEEGFATIKYINGSDGDDIVTRELTLPVWVIDSYVLREEVVPLYNEVERVFKEHFAKAEEEFEKNKKMKEDRERRWVEDFAEAVRPVLDEAKAAVAEFDALLANPEKLVKAAETMDALKKLFKNRGIEL